MRVLVSKYPPPSTPKEEEQEEEICEAYSFKVFLILHTGELKKKKKKKKKSFAESGEKRRCKRVCVRARACLCERAGTHALAPIPRTNTHYLIIHTVNKDIPMQLIRY